MDFRLSISTLICFLMMLSCPLRGQQILNLGFERSSVEGISRPWGWNVFGDVKCRSVMDSSIRREGKYSLKIYSDTSQEGAAVKQFNFDLEPYELIKKTITIGGWVKTFQLTGEASFSLSYTIGTDPSSLPINSRGSILKNTNDWKYISTSLKLPDSANSVTLSIQFEGQGTAWFDDFELIVNGKELQQVEIAKPFTSSQEQWLDRWSNNIKKVDATLGTQNPFYEDLLSLKKMVNKAKIIALGESTHGTSEFFRLKHRVLEYAVNELGVRVFAIEDNQLVVERVNKYVLGGPGTARSSMYGMFSVWQNEEVHNMIEWVRQYNDNHITDKVMFMGFDVQDFKLPVDSLMAFVKNHVKENEAEIEQLISDIKKNGANSFMMSDSIKQLWYQNSVSIKKIIDQECEKLLKYATNRTDSLIIFWGRQFANLVKQFAENTLKGHLSFYRDVAMAENISWILSIGKAETKMLIWAHDYHISRGDHSDNDINIYNGKSMGFHLSKKYGPGYKAFALSTYEGTYWAQVSYMNFKMLSCPIHPSPKGTLEEALHRLSVKRKTPGLLVDLSRARAENWLSVPIPMRFANHVNIEYGYWTRYSIPYQFDGIFFIDKTSAAKSYVKN